MISGLGTRSKAGREFSGLTVRRDPGGTFIWLATGIFLLRISALTFYAQAQACGVR